MAEDMRSNTEPITTAPPPPAPAGAPLGSIFFGLILMALGVLWLLDLAGVINVTWTIIGAVMLVLIGVALIAGAREGAHGGLIALGVILAAILALASVATVPRIGSGVGERTHRPDSIAAIADEYRWGMGEQTLDLSGIEFPSGDYQVEVSHGIGDLTIIVPDDVEIRVVWSVGVGEITLIDRQHSGVGISGDWATPTYGNADVSLRIDLSMGIGSVTVRQ